MSPSNRSGRKWLRIGERGRTKAIRMADKGWQRYFPSKRVKRWFWQLPTPNPSNGEGR